MENNKTNKKLVLYFTILAVVCAVINFAIIRYTNGLSGASALVFGLMYAPAFAAFCSKLVYDHTLKGIGWGIKGFKGIGIAYILPPVACLIVYGLTWISGLGTYVKMPVIQVVAYATLGVLGSMISAFGEEIGWRGFLLTELRKKYSFHKINLIIGLVWFFYHLPIMLGSDYNNGNLLISIMCFFVMTMSFTVIANALCITSNSVWPSVVIHASHNLFVQNLFDPMTQNHKYTQYVTSEFGIGLAICYSLVAIWILVKEAKKGTISSRI